MRKKKLNFSRSSSKLGTESDWLVMTDKLTNHNHIRCPNNLMQIADADALDPNKVSKVITDL